MSRDERPETRLDDAVREQLERVLAEHPVSFAMLFGSAGRETLSDTSALDLAVEFESLRPTDDGYSQVYLELTAAVDDAVSRSVDVVDIHSMSPAFARAAFDHGVVLVGSDAQRERLERDLAGEASTVADAHERVAAAANRLREGQ
ncbi:type VII toxin-antitoxin system MntA family adenylyltransferase antitoxin [Candidatus Halobonum tyrrellensis]|uniref:Nucleotidyltransferase domain protein n=1 Tax=Candidatus Halobonum tyrrellensis G22 TaxID=1324957 RepID=V4GN62_9EURY|nr:nucleotidyltransferase domain-containing protein [Candidatus Halobonum tyrrellensis]ESP86806.1 nucleotidyltransferase domain protein [Candidatus Halobonum tyrrellensis G22]